jgi:hypothetical protein
MCYNYKLAISPIKFTISSYLIRGYQNVNVGSTKLAILSSRKHFPILAYASPRACIVCSTTAVDGLSR